MISLRYISILLGLGSVSSTAAQDIVTEVVVERDIVNNAQPATRPAAPVPVLQLPSYVPEVLSTAAYATMAALQPMYTTMRPAAAVQIPQPGPWRGYVSAAYGPVYNAGIAAGYRLQPTSVSTLDLHGIFSGYHYGSSAEGADGYTYNGVDLGADYRLGVGQHSTLTASLGYMGGSASSATHEAMMRNALDMYAGWASRAGGLTYSAAIGALIDFYGACDMRDMPKPLRLNSFAQQRLNVNADASLPFGEYSSVALGLDYDMLHTGNLGTLGTAVLHPSVTFGTASARALIGLNIGLSHSSAATRFHLSPNIELSWQPVSYLTLKAAATGALGLKSTADACNITPFWGGSPIHNVSEVPYDLTGTIIAGPAHGFRAKLEGGYSHAKGVLVGGPDAIMPVAPLALKGWHGELDLSYTASIWGVHASAALASSDMSEGRGYYLWHDGAARVFTAGGHVCPIEGLKIGVDYELRSGRHTPWQSLATVSDLGLQATYRISAPLDVFLTLDNILGRRYDIVPTIESRSISCLVGVTYKF